MNIYYLIYVIISSLVLFFVPFILFCTWLTGRYHKLIIERFGYYSFKRSLPKKNRLWLHAVSVGEVKVAQSVIEKLFEIDSNLDIILSTTTPKGYDVAQTINRSHLQCLYAPIDSLASVRLAFHHIKPDILVLLETEIWPNWIYTANALNIPVVIVNGRISKKTVSGYLKFSSLAHFIVKKIDAFSMISTQDAHRICQIGAEPKKVHVSGNAKFDILQSTCSNPLLPVQLKKCLNIGPEDFVFIAGSTRSGEEKMVLSAFQSLQKKYPNAICMIAPRHVERCPSIESYMLQCRLTYNRYSQCKGIQNRDAQIILVDTIGDLANLYSIASVVFCGGSLVPQGGQNVLEPAVWAKPVIYGPYMDDFLWAKTILEASSGGIEVKNEQELTEKVLMLASDKKQSIKFGQSARTSVLKESGASEKHVQIILKTMQQYRK
jgi:3-deoxy-D-manno-octulosonic-acid transferase